MLVIRERVRICSLGERGGFFKTPGSAGSKPRLCAGGPSIITFIHKICIGFKGFGIFSRVHIEINISAAESENQANLAILLIIKILLLLKLVFIID